MWIDDQVISECQKAFTLKAWVPDKPMVVLGRSNQIEECHAELARQDHIEVLQRYGGGGAVVLYPGSLVVSIGTWVKDRFQNDFYFRKLNQALIELLANQYPQLATKLSQNGISDITLQADSEKKIAGTSLFRSRNYLLYQASILVTPDIALISKYLPHPSKEPKYRGERDHRSFLTSLSEAEPTITSAELCAKLLDLGPEFFMKELDGELIEVQSSQCPHLLKKIGVPE